MDERKYEMILCIVNAGFSGLVMDAAKEAGAKGGTLLRGRGTANREAEEFFHIAKSATTTSSGGLQTAL